jgi:hypothetical protein
VGTGSLDFVIWTDTDRDTDMYLGWYVVAGGRESMQDLIETKLDI